jgi:WD40 repeat protein
MTAPKRQLSDAGDQPTIAVITKAIEQIRAAMGAAGALLAIRDIRGLRQLASAGHVPASGSTLQLDSEFTRECIETGRIVLCEDANIDPRIRLGAARILHLRSAVAVPIQFRGSSIGLIELFSSLPGTFNGQHIVTLQEIGDLLAPLLASESARASHFVSSIRNLAISRSQILALPQDELIEEAEVLEFGAPSREPVPSVAPPANARPRPSGVAIPFAAIRRLLLATTAGRTALLGTGALAAVALILLFTRPAPNATQEQMVATRSLLPVPSQSPGTDTPNAHALIEAPPPAAPAGTQIASTIKSLSFASIPPIVASGLVHKSSVGNPSPLPVDPLSQLSHRRNDPRSAIVSAQLLSTAVEAPLAPNPAPSVENDAAALPLPSTLPVETHAESLILAGNTSAERTSTPATSATVAFLKSTNNSRPDFVLDRTVKGHSGWVTGVAFTSDGRRLVSGSWDQTVKMWDVPSGAELSSVDNKDKQNKGKEVEALAFSRDGHWLAAENSGDNVTLWDAGTGAQIRTLATDKRLTGVGNNFVYSIAFSPDGQLLASAVDDRTVRLWDVKTGQVVRDLTGYHRSVIYIAFSPDGRLLASGDDEKNITIWNVSTGVAVRKLTGHKKLVYAVAFSPNGRWLASASADKTIKIWDVELGREVHTLLGHSGLVTSLAFSPDGHWLASGSWDKTIKIWDVESGREVQTLDGHRHSIYAIAFDSRGRCIASGSEDGTISLWRWNPAEAARN